MTRFDELQKNLFFALLLFVLMATVPLVITQRYLLGEVITFMLWASVALQWNVLMGHAGVFSLGQMLFFVSGSYTVAMLGASPHFGTAALRFSSDIVAWRDNGGGYRTCDWCCLLAVG